MISLKNGRYEVEELPNREAVCGRSCICREYFPRCDRRCSLLSSRTAEALTLKPVYAPAILSIGSVEYQRKHRAKGRRLFFSLLALPEDTEVLSEIIDKAGSFLIDIEEYADGLQLFREAASKFPEVAKVSGRYRLLCGS